MVHHQLVDQQQQHHHLIVHHHLQNNHHRLVHDGIFELKIKSNEIIQMKTKQNSKYYDYDDNDDK